RRRACRAVELGSLRPPCDAPSMRRGPQDPEELRAARLARAVHHRDPAAIDEVVEAGGHRVPVRTLTPASAAIRGVLLDLHGGGFFMDSAARSDARNRALAE